MKFMIPADLLLLEALALQFPESSKSSLRDWIKQGRVTIDGARAKLANQPVAKGQSIIIEPKRRLVEERIPIVYEDEHLIVIDKPAGLLSVSTAFEKSETAFGYLKRKFRPRSVHVVHRLDQETSGVMLFALTEDACTALKKLFEKHELTRRYVAVVEGRMTEPQGTWQSYLVEDRQYVVRSTSDSRIGELAITHFRVDAASRQYSWLTLTLETGKKNQIRVHCRDAGHPVVGDKKYGGSGSPVKRLCLHAQLLAFVHPMTGKAMKFSSAVPAAFHQLIEPAAGRCDA